MNEEEFERLMGEARAHRVDTSRAELGLETRLTARFAHLAERARRGAAG